MSATFDSTGSGTIGTPAPWALQSKPVSLEVVARFGSQSSSELTSIGTLEQCEHSPSRRRPRLESNDPAVVLVTTGHAEHLTTTRGRSITKQRRARGNGTAGSQQPAQLLVGRSSQNVAAHDTAAHDCFRDTTSYGTTLVIPRVGVKASLGRRTDERPALRGFEGDGLLPAAKPRHATRVWRVAPARCRAGAPSEPVMWNST